MVRCCRRFSSTTIVTWVQYVTRRKCDRVNLSLPQTDAGTDWIAGITATGTTSNTVVAEMIMVPTPYISSIKPTVAGPHLADFDPNSAIFGLCSLRSFGAELLTARMVQDGVYVECAVGGGHLQSRHSLTDVCSLSSKVSMSRSPRSTRSVPYQSSYWYH